MQVLDPQSFQLEHHSIQVGSLDFWQLVFWQAVPSLFRIEAPALARLLPARATGPLIGGSLRERFDLSDMSLELLHNHLLLWGTRL